MHSPIPNNSNKSFEEIISNGIIKCEHCEKFPVEASRMIQYQDDMCIYLYCQKCWKGLMKTLLPANL